ncbi:hypothetical protein ACFWAX_31180 [Streptomyces sp. NPDC059956]
MGIPAAHALPPLARLLEAFRSRCDAAVELQGEFRVRHDSHFEEDFRA